MALLEYLDWIPWCNSAENVQIPVTSMCMHIYVSIYIYIYIYAHPSPPMLHTKLLFLSSGSWEVGNLGCENIGRDQISQKS